MQITSLLIALMLFTVSLMLAVCVSDIKDMRRKIKKGVADRAELFGTVCYTLVTLIGVLATIFVVIWEAI